MAYILAKLFYPRTIDEKISCEVVIYAWVQENSAEISIPVLIGFGFMDCRYNLKYLIYNWFKIASKSLIIISHTYSKFL
jgi:hypothetical protein